MNPSVRVEKDAIVIRLDEDGARWMIDYLPPTDGLTTMLKNAVAKLAEACYGAALGAQGDAEPRGLRRAAALAASERGPRYGGVSLHRCTRFNVTATPRSGVQTRRCNDCGEIGDYDAETGRSLEAQGAAEPRATATDADDKELLPVPCCAACGLIDRDPANHETRMRDSHAFEPNAFYLKWLLAHAEIPTEEDEWIPDADERGGE